MKENNSLYFITFLKYLKKFILFLNFVLLFDNANSQITRITRPNWLTNPPNIGLRATSMGNAFIGLADDASAIYWNPAGLSLTRIPQISLVGRLGINKISASDLSYLDLSDKSKIEINYLALVYPINHSLVLGAAYYTYFDMVSSQTTAWKLDGLTYSISPSISFSLLNNVMLGITANFVRGNIDRNSRSKNEIPYHPDGSGNVSGTFFKIGFLIKFLNKISLGLTLDSPYKLKVNNHNIGGSLSSKDIPEFKGKISLYDKIEEKIIEIPYDCVLYSSVIEPIMKIPMKYCVGMAFQPIHNLLITSDIHFNPYSNSKLEFTKNGYLSVETSKKKYKFKEINADLLDINSIHFGVEYIINFNNFKIPLRIGYQRIPEQFFDTAVHQDEEGICHFTQVGVVGEHFTIIKYVENISSDEYVTIMMDEVDDRIVSNVITFGLGFKFKNLEFGASVGIKNYSYLESPYDEVLVQPGFYRTIPCNIKNSVFNFFTGLSYNFNK